MAYSFNQGMETKGFPKVTGSHVCCKNCNILVTV